MIRKTSLGFALTFVLVVTPILGAASPRLRFDVERFANPPSDVSDLIVKANTSTQAKFQTWLSGFRARARSQGIKPATLDQALNGITYAPKIVELDRRQVDFTKTIAQYLDGAVSRDRINGGRAALKKYRSTLEAIEERYKVDKEVIVAVWGLETSYGGFRGKSDIIRSLATLAFDGRRSAFFEAELIAALKIIQSGDTSAANMRGSWAGAMGHTQFMPSSYNAHAVDFNGDGRRSRARARAMRWR